MAISRTPRVWIGIGAAALIGGQASSAASAQVQQPAATTAPAQAGHADHDKASAAPQAATATATAKPDGEGGEGAGADLDPRIRMLRDMSLIRGHLLVGDELVKAGRWEDALPHFHHPVEELYPAIGPKLKGQGIRQFDSALKALAQTVQAKKADAYKTSWTTVDQRMTEADAGLRKFETPRIAARIQTVMAVLQTAGAEYGQSIEDGKFAKPVEYQDSRGFVWFADKLFETLAPDLEKQDKAALAAMRAAFADLKTAWPAPLPPEKPIKDQAGVLSAISKVEFAASPFLK